MVQKNKDKNKDKDNEIIIKIKELNEMFDEHFKVKQLDIDLP